MGIVSAINESRWNTPDGKLPPHITIENITADYVIYTDVVFTPNMVLKGSPTPDKLRIRTFGGQVGSDRMTVAAEELVPDQQYILFLVKDTGLTASVGPEHYIVFGSIQGVYEIKGDRAISQVALRGEQQRSDPAQPKDEKGLEGLLVSDLISRIRQSK